VVFLPPPVNNGFIVNIGYFGSFGHFGSFKQYLRQRFQNDQKDQHFHPPFMKRYYQPYLYKGISEVQCVPS
jgi:hypothetical protein